MPTLPEHLEELAEHLAELGVYATADPSKLKVPGVLIKPLKLEQPTLHGQYDITVQLVAAVEDRHMTTVLTDLEALITKIEASYSLPIRDWDLDQSLELANNLLLPAAATTITI